MSLTLNVTDCSTFNLLTKWKRHGMPRFALALLVLVATAWGSGYLTLETNPAGAEIWYANTGGNERRYLGDSPIQDREMTPGQYDFWIIVENRDTLTLPGITLSEGQHTQVSRELPLHYAYLELTTDPDSGLIRMDDVELGSAPYTNPLVHPNTYRLQLTPKSVRYRPRIEHLTLVKGDSLRLKRLFSFRDKSFLRENLSISPGMVQIESGIRYRSLYGSIDTVGKRQNFPNDSVKSQADFPLTLRVGLPFGLEPHVLIPFKSYEKVGGGAPFASDLAFGLKLALREYNAGLDITYSIGRKSTEGGLNHDVLTLQALGMLDKDKLLFQGNAAFEFHFHDRDDHQLNPGNQVVLYAQAGYVAAPVMPYIAALVHFKMGGDQAGKDLNNSNYGIGLEPGLTLDIQDWVSFQLGIPFEVMGKSDALYWGLHFSLAVRFGIMD
jgi:hypothetical protein